MTPIHISDNMFAMIPRHFSDFAAAATELAQNAYRATLESNNHRVMVTTTEDTVVCTDTGCGIMDFGKMLSLAVSEWSEITRQAQDPAGLGVCAILAYARRVTWTTCLGPGHPVRSITVESVPFFASAGYRAALAEMVDTGETSLTSFTTVTMEGVKESPSRVRDELQQAFRWFPNLQVTINDATLSSGLAALRATHPRPVLVDGHEVLVLSKDEYLYGRANARLARAVVWHGCLIPGPDYNADNSLLKPDDPDMPPIMQQYWPAHLSDGVYTEACDLHYALVCTPGHLCVTPKLPDRTSLVWNDKTKAFMAKVQRAVSIRRIEDAIDALRLLANTKGKLTDLSRFHGVPQSLFGALKQAIYPVYAFREPEIDENESDDPKHIVTVQLASKCDHILSERLLVLDEASQDVRELTNSEIGPIFEVSDDKLNVVIEPEKSNLLPRSVAVVLLPGAFTGRYSSMFADLPGGVDLALVPEDEADNFDERTHAEMRARYPIIHVEGIGFWSGDFTDSVTSSMFLAGVRSTCEELSNEFKHAATTHSVVDEAVSDDGDTTRSSYTEEKCEEFEVFWAQYGGRFPLSRFYSITRDVLGIGRLGDTKLIVTEDTVTQQGANGMVMKIWKS